MEDYMTLLVNLYYHHQLPKADPQLAERRNRCNEQAEELLKQMRNHPAPSKPQTALEDLHHLIKQANALPWVKRTEILKQRYFQNRFKAWPGEVLMLLAILFPADEPKAKLVGKENYNLFKTLTAMLLHLEEEQLQPA